MVTRRVAGDELAKVHRVGGAQCRIAYESRSGGVAAFFLEPIAAKHFVSVLSCPYESPSTREQSEHSAIVQTLDLSEQRYSPR